MFAQPGPTAQEANHRKNTTIRGKKRRRKKIQKLAQSKYHIHSSALGTRKRRKKENSRGPNGSPGKLYWNKNGEGEGYVQLAKARRLTIKRKNRPIMRRGVGTNKVYTEGGRGAKTAKKDMFSGKRSANGPTGEKKKVRKNGRTTSFTGLGGKRGVKSNNVRRKRRGKNLNRWRFHRFFRNQKTQKKHKKRMKKEREHLISSNRTDYSVIVESSTERGVKRI